MMAIKRPQSRFEGLPETTMNGNRGDLKGEMHLELMPSRMRGQDE